MVRFKNGTETGALGLERSHFFVQLQQAKIILQIQKIEINPLHFSVNMVN